MNKSELECVWHSVTFALENEFKTRGWLPPHAARIKTLEAEVEKWHRVAMKAGTVPCVDDAVARLSRELVIELDTYWSGTSGPSLSGIMLDWRNKYRILLEDGDLPMREMQRELTPEEDQELRAALLASTTRVEVIK